MTNKFNKNLENQLESMARLGQMVTTNEYGQIITVQDLLQHKLGRFVEYDEAIEYVKKVRKAEFTRKLLAKHGHYKLTN